MVSKDKYYIQRALTLAKRGRGRTSPNPLVGAVLVKDNHIVGEGYHACVGGPHAEVRAIEAAGEQAQGATLYLNLEPCAHFGRTPPCADLIIQRGIHKVVCSMVDPNPLVNGKGFERLQSAGIVVEVGILQEKARELNESYAKHIVQGLPFVTLKLAQSLDGQIAAQTGESRWISSEQSRRRVHRLRSEMDAVMVGVDTVIQDDPQLDVRLVKGRNPIKIVVDSTLRIPLRAKVFHGARLIVATTDESPLERRTQVRDGGADIWILPDRNGRVDLSALMVEVGKQDITGLLIEGGSQLATSALQQGIVDRLIVFIAPILLGKGIPAIGDLGIGRILDAVRLRDIRIQRIGDDLLYQARVRHKKVESGK